MICTATGEVAAAAVNLMKIFHKLFFSSLLGTLTKNTTRPSGWIHGYLGGSINSTGTHVCKNLVYQYSVPLSTSLMSKSASPSNSVSSNAGLGFRAYIRIMLRDEG